ncbi:MAG: cell wall anchor protein, partial [Bacteroidota bacterium]
MHFVKAIYTLIALCITLTGISQIGINTTSPDSSAALDIVSSNKGLLIPRVNPLDITDPVEGLLIIEAGTSNLLKFNG